ASAQFGVFLSRLIGKLGDRHAGVRNLELPNSQFLPFVAAPLDGRVMALVLDRKTRTHQLRFPSYPYLKSINDTPIDAFLADIAPRDEKAPADAFFTRSVKQLKYMESNFYLKGKELPEEVRFTFTGSNGDTTVLMPLERKRRKHFTWQDEFYLFGARRKQLTDTATVRKQFRIDPDGIAYMQLSHMVYPEETPIFFQEFNSFLKRAKDSEALVVDVRSNGGGRRHLILELAKYLVHPDSIYVVNVARQRSDGPLNAEQKEDLHNRFLFAMDELDAREQAAVKKFLTSFQPSYELPDDRFGPMYFTVLNGQKLKKGAYHYDRPVYIMVNEYSFSAASVLAACFKGLPNVQLVGVTTDGSSGNSEGFFLPQSNYRIKLSTMVSFQKDGRLLDGQGTVPDVVIRRNEEQIFWEKDHQWNRLREVIYEKIGR
ncbi:MAG: S41 family peptidase, partial [Bacteroidota bacterium]